MVKSKKVSSQRRTYSSSYSVTVIQETKKSVIRFGRTPFTNSGVPHLFLLVWKTLLNRRKCLLKESQLYSILVFPERGRGMSWTVTISGVLLGVVSLFFEVFGNVYIIKRDSSELSL